MKDFRGLGFGVGINCVAPIEEKDVRKIFVIHLTLQASFYPGSGSPLKELSLFSSTDLSGTSLLSFHSILHPG